jgi:hypothetical protein
MKRAAYLIVALAWLAMSEAHAQGIADLPSGTRVRVTVPDSVRQAPFIRRRQFVIATLVRATSDTLWLNVAGPDTLRLPRALTAVQASRGVSRTRSAVQFGLGMGLAGLAVRYPGAHDEHTRQEAVALAGVGALVGALIGAWSPYESWRRVR